MSVALGPQIASAAGVKLGAGYSMLAGVSSAIGSVLIDVRFWQAIVIAGVTGVIAGVGTVLGALLAARISAKTAEPIARDVEHIKRAGGLTRRAGDEQQ